MNMSKKKKERKKYERIYSFELFVEESTVKLTCIRGMFCRGELAGLSKLLIGELLNP